MIKQISFEETYPLRHKVMWPNKPLDYIKVAGDEEAIHFGYFENDALISVISLFIKGDTGQFRKFATDIPHQGKGYGSKLLKHLIGYAKDQNLDTIICNARIEKTDFYKSFNMKTTDKTFEKGGKRYVIMALNLKEEN